METICISRILIKKGNITMSKKIITLLIAASLFAAASACGTVENAGDIPEPTEATTETTTEEDTEPSTEEEEKTTEPTDETEPSSEATSEDEESSTEKATQEKTTQEETEAAVQQTDPPVTDAPEPDPTEAPAAVGSFSHDDMTFICGGAQAAVYADASGLVAVLGSPNDVQEAQGCLSNGCDQKIYYYTGISVYTYIDGGREIIYDIEITSASYPTAKGLKVGMSAADMENLYGTGYSAYGNDYCYYDYDGSYLYISTSGGSITSIEYCADV